MTEPLIVDNKRIHDLIVDKDVLVQEGRKISQDIEDVEKQVKVFENKEKKITAKVVPPKELTDRGDEVAKQMEKLGDELNEIATKINNSKLDSIPKEMKEEHMALLKAKEKMERERNKVALKVQKIKDKVVPIIQKVVKPLLEEYDDIETAKIKDGKVIITTFNYLEDWKRKFRR